VNTADVPRIPYRQHVYSVERPRSTHHYGQRKLLNSEVQCLLDNARDNDTIVYAGSAPGIHIPFLASLFQKMNLSYVLIDPRPFKLPKGYPGIAGKIETRRGFFTEETAKEFAGRDDIIFISDIRSGTDGPEIPSDDTVEGDMKMQEDWVLAMNPRVALLKYRLNYTKSDGAPYLVGDVRIQIWPGPKSTETRLEARRPYHRAPTDAHDHEERMAYINTVLREWASYDHGVPLTMAPGLDRGFDSACEVRIWRRYLAKMGSTAWQPRRVAAATDDSTGTAWRSRRAAADGQLPIDLASGLTSGSTGGLTSGLTSITVSDDARQIAELITRASTALRRNLDPPDGPQRRL
jgi:hypothetical protein